MTNNSDYACRRLATLLLVLLVATLPLASLAAITTEDVEKLLQQRQFFTATQRAEQLIANGNLDAAVLATVHLQRGRALQERLHIREAVADFQQARELAPQSAEAAYWLGRSYARYDRQNQGTALELLRQASQAGIADADYEIGLLFGDALDKPEGVDALERAANKGVLRGIDALARMYLYGRGKPQNLAEAFRLFRQAAERGDAQSQYELAIAYAAGRGVAKDEAQSRSWQQRALAQGHAGAHLMQGNRLDASDARGAQYQYWRAAQGGLPAGIINIGLAYLRGRGVEQDWLRALRWLYQAEGIPMADFYSGGMYLYGLGVERNDPAAFEFLQRAAGVMPDAKALLASLYQSGIGVQHDGATAQRLMEEVLSQGDATSLSIAAWMLATSERADLRQPELAVRLATKSVELDPAGDGLPALAAAYAAAGDFDHAVETQRRFVQQAPPPERAAREKRLVRYQAHEIWTEPFQETQPAAAARRAAKTRPVATFVGEVVQLMQTPAGRRQPGYEIDTDCPFAIRVLVEKVEQGSLPHFMQQSALFYIHSPTRLFGKLQPQVPAFSLPTGPQRFVLTEVEADDWAFRLEVRGLADR